MLIFFLWRCLGRGEARGQAGVGFVSSWQSFSDKIFFFRPDRKKYPKRYYSKKNMFLDRKKNMFLDRKKTCLVVRNER